jgi:hypothetical protein
MTYTFIKSHIQMETELRQLWDNYPLYKFICDAQYVRKRELDICECLPDINGQRQLFIELCRFDWIIDDDEKSKKNKKKRSH